MKEQAIEILISYINHYKVDFFAVPVEKPDRLSIALVSSERIIELARNDAPIFEQHKNELFCRLRRKYKAIKILPILHPVAVIDTHLRNVNDIPEYRDLRSRGWELVVNQYVNGVHYGDKLKDIDIISPVYGRIECKVGAGRFGEYD